MSSHGASRSSTRGVRPSSAEFRPSRSWILASAFYLKAAGVLLTLKNCSRACTIQLGAATVAHQHYSVINSFSRPACCRHKLVQSLSTRSTAVHAACVRSRMQGLSAAVRTLRLMWAVAVGLLALPAGQAMPQNGPPQLEALPLAPPGRDSSAAAPSERAQANILRQLEGGVCASQPTATSLLRHMQQRRTVCLRQLLAVAPGSCRHIIAMSKPCRKTCRMRYHIHMHAACCGTCSTRVYMHQHVATHRCAMHCYDAADVRLTPICCGCLLQAGECSAGDDCPFSHNTFEMSLHPLRSVAQNALLPWKDHRNM